MCAVVLKIEIRWYFSVRVFLCSSAWKYVNDCRNWVETSVSDVIAPYTDVIITHRSKSLSFCFFPVSSVSFSSESLLSPFCLTSICLIYMLSHLTPPSLPLVRQAIFFFALPCLSLSPVIHCFFASSHFSTSYPDSWAGWCWRCFLPYLAVFKLTSTICPICTESRKRYKHQSTYTCICRSNVLPLVFIYMQMGHNCFLKDCHLLLQRMEETVFIWT